MKNAELIASLRTKIKALRGRVDSLPTADSGFGGGLDGMDGQGDLGDEGQEVYMALRNERMETVDGIVKFIRAGVDMEEVVFFINSQRQMH